MEPFARLPKNVLDADHLVQNYASDVFVAAITETRDVITAPPRRDLNVSMFLRENRFLRKKWQHCR